MQAQPEKKTRETKDEITRDVYHRYVEDELWLEGHCSCTAENGREVKISGVLANLDKQITPSRVNKVKRKRGKRECKVCGSNG